MTSFPSFASVNLFWFAVVAASLCQGAGGEVSLRRHGGTAAQRRGYNTCHATGLRLLRNRDGKGVRGANAFPNSPRCSPRRGRSVSLRFVQDPFCRRLARLKLRTGVSGSFRIKQSGAITTSIPSTRSNTRVRLPGNAQIRQPVLAEARS
jgi:hypothetical protein